MINLLAITDPHSKIIALQGLADELAREAGCRKALSITKRHIRKIKIKQELKPQPRR